MPSDSSESQANVKLPPHDLDAEEAVLGSLLIDAEAIFKIAPLLKPDDFYREKNRWTYECCISLYERREAINQIAVAHELARQQKLEASGGAAYLSHLVYQVPTSVHAEHYANIVRRLSLMRRLISASNQIAAIGYESPPDTMRPLTERRASSSVCGMARANAALSTSVRCSTAISRRAV